MSVKTMPLNDEVLEHQTPAVFFGTTLQHRQPPGKFYVFGRPYIARATHSGTLVLFHLGGRIVAGARLQDNWWRRNDDPVNREEAICMYLLDNIMVFDLPIQMADLPLAWQNRWERGRFDQNPRTLDDAFEQEFLAHVRHRIRWTAGQGSPALLP